MAGKGRPFKKGKPPGPGRPKTPSDIKEARGLTRQKFEKMANRFMDMTKEEMTKVLNDPNTTALELMVGKVIFEAVKHGDQKRLDFILDRAIGKVPKPLELTGADGGPIKYDDYSDLSDEDVEARLLKVRARIARLPIE